MSNNRKRSRTARTTRALHHTLRGSLVQFPEAVPLDPWGHPHEYISFAEQSYHPYSRDPDAWTDPSLNHGDGRDGIVRGPDGDSVGLASDY